MLARTHKRILYFLWAFLFVFPTVFHAVSVKSYSYDKYGNIQEITDPRGGVTQYHYDLLNRIEKIDYPDHRKVKYSYDLSGIRTKMEDHRGVTLFEPDEFGKINKVTFPDGQSVSYRYDSEGNLVKLIYPDRTEIEYAYDLSNRLETVKDFSGITKFEYDELNNALRKKILPNGVTTEYQFYKSRKISNVIHKKADGNLIEEFRYCYDENGNRTKIEKISPMGDSHVIYTYDKLNRILKAEYSDGFFESFSYDGAGNRSSKITPQGAISYEYDEENRLEKAGNTTYLYDLAGNLIEKSSPGNKSTYKYDFDNRLIFYSDESNEVAFEYDGDGNRISKTVNGVRTDYINDLVAPVSQVLLKRVRGNWLKGEKTIHYAYGGSRISQTTEGRTQFYLYDSIGRNVSALVSSSGKVLNSYEYDAFGGCLFEEQDVPNVYKYCGEQFDQETGLIFLRNRYYDPEIGRFISKDPHPGKLGRPATLNPYCYVENNPVNFIDPWGFEAIQPEEFELVIAHVNALPGWFGGQGVGGHVFVELPARGDTTPYFGNYPKHPSINEAAHVNAKTVSVAAYCNSQKISRALDSMQEIKWTACKNCVHTVLEGMKIMEFPHAEKIQLSTIPLPSEFQSQMLKLHEGDPIRPISYGRGETQNPSKGISPSGFNFSSGLDYGGVSLSKTAELQLGLANITGAAFDSVTGQLVLFGPQDRYFPPVDIDDLAVAVRSVFGIGISYPEDPGVSIGTEYSPVEGQMKVRYNGATVNTSFGQTMFEADRLLKCITHGRDNITGRSISVDVPGYLSLIDRLAAHQFSSSASNLMWFVPDRIILLEAEDHKGIVFGDVRMKVLTEAQLNGSTSQIPGCVEFAEHFTAHFDEFAKQFPILEKLKSLGKITAIVKWIRENQISFDTSFFANYQPKRVEVTQYTPSLESIAQWVVEGGETKRKKKKKKVAVQNLYSLQTIGGVNYSLNSGNFASYVNIGANDFTSIALKSRPSEQDFTWSFLSPTNRETYVAVAQSIQRTRKPGNVKKTYTDMSFPVRGSETLSLQRFYNSFSEVRSPFGHGWRVVPYELEIPLEKISVAVNGELTIACFPGVLVRTPDGENFYQLHTFGGDNRPIFKDPDHSNFLKDNLDGTFTLSLSDKGHMNFDGLGRLVRTIDLSGLSIEYQYDNNQLSRICHQTGTTIFLEYKDGFVVRAFGPNSNVIHYTYHDNGQLKTVGDFKGPYLHYSYDADRRLNKITDHLETSLFEAVYDGYNRAVALKEGSVSYHSNFSLEKKTMTMTDHQGRESFLQFDAKDRLIHQKDPSGLIWEFFYGQDGINFPTKIVDAKGGITECRYNLSGNLTYFKNPIGAEWRFFYDSNENLVAQMEPNGRAVFNIYGEKNRISQTFYKASLGIDQNDRFSPNINKTNIDGGYAVCFGYDKQTGNLISHSNSKRAEIRFTYHESGQLKEIIYPNGYTVEHKVDEQGNILEISDGYGFQRRYDYDEANRLKTVRTFAGETNFTYDEARNLKRIMDPRGSSTSYAYDVEHNLKEVVDAAGAVTFYEYNCFNQLTHISLPNGTCKTIKYDSFGRPDQEIWGK